MSSAMSWALSLYPSNPFFLFMDAIRPDCFDTIQSFQDLLNFKAIGRCGYTGANYLLETNDWKLWAVAFLSAYMLYTLLRMVVVNFGKMVSWTLKTGATVFVLSLVLSWAIYFINEDDNFQGSTAEKQSFASTATSILRSATKSIAAPTYNIQTAAPYPAEEL